MVKGSYSPLIYNYLRKYQEDPTSRIFAPLAEAYRKAGLVEEAIEIAREGLTLHPQFIGGRVALARALFDKRNYGDVVVELVQVVQDAPDNLVAQRLFAESCLILGRTAEALDAYKMLLYYSPQDCELAKIVQELEVQAYKNGSLVLQTDIEDIAHEVPQFEIVGPQTALAAPKEEISESKVNREDRIKKVERLQEMLQSVAAYRAEHSRRI
jgi:predicted Zn-dependent protease